MWSAGASPKGVGWCTVRDRVMLLAPLVIWVSGWIGVLASVGFMVKWVAFLGSLRWLVGDADLGVGCFLC